MTNRIKLVVLAAVCLGAGAWTMLRPIHARRVARKQIRYRVPIGESPIRGAPDAKLTIVEFGDFQSPACARLDRTLRELFDGPLGRDLRLVWKDNPQPHDLHALEAAAAGRFAAQRGKFWEMHDLLFQNASALWPAMLGRYATEVGLDGNQLVAAIERNEYDEDVAVDHADAEFLAARGVPFLFINGRAVAGAPTRRELERILYQELQLADEVLARGVPAARLYEEITAHGLSHSPDVKLARLEREEVDRHKIYRVELGDAPAIGPDDALVTAVVWSDFECPFSRNLDRTLETVRGRHAADVRWVWKNDPLPFHPHARLAAAAGLAAAAQGQFWPLRARLFSHPDHLDRADLLRDAAVLGLDVAHFERDLDAPETARRIDTDLAEAARLGVSGTPTLFFNGVPLVGSVSEDELEAAITSAIERARAALASGVARKDLYAHLTSQGVQEAALVKPRSAPLELDDTVTPIATDGSPARGPDHAPITIVEFGDFECPFCARVADTLEQLERAHPGKIRVVWKHHVLPHHRNALLAAEAAMAAGEQGRFWPMHDLLLRHRHSLDRASLETFAAELGLDLTRFRAALDNHTYRAHVLSDGQEARKIDRTMSAPTLFVNGRQIPGAYPLDMFEAIIQSELQRAKLAVR